MSTWSRPTAGALVGALEPILGPPGPLTPSGTDIEMDIYGAKLRLFGDAVFAQDSWLPQVAVGVQHKRNRDFGSGVMVPYLGDVGIPALLGAHVMPTAPTTTSRQPRSFLGVPAGRNLILNGTLRATKANAFGLLGFGREVINPLDGERLDGSNSYRLEYEARPRLFLTPDRLLLEPNTEPSPIGCPISRSWACWARPIWRKEDDVYDFFLAWLPSKNVAVTAAWVHLGNLPFQSNSNAAYLSLQLSF
jgi:hypothetical protein